MSETGHETAASDWVGVQDVQITSLKLKQLQTNGQLLE